MRAHARRAAAGCWAWAGPILVWRVPIDEMPYAPYRKTFLLFYASDTPFSIASARLCGHVWRMDRLLHPMDRPTCGWWPRHIQRPALCGDGVAAAAASLVGSGAESLCSALSWPRCAPATAPEPGSELADGTLGRSAHASDAPPSTVAYAPRDASRIFAKSVGTRAACARRVQEQRRMQERNFFNFFHNFYLGMHYR